MKALFSILLAGLCLCDEILLLPHRWHDARHEVNRMIRDADTLTIATDAIDDAHLQRALRHALEEGTSLTLITPFEVTAGQWAKYNNVFVCLLSKAPLGFTLIANAKKGCLLTASLRTETLQREYGALYCSKPATQQQTIELLKGECEAYLH